MVAGILYRGLCYGAALSFCASYGFFVRATARTDNEVFGRLYDRGRNIRLGSDMGFQ
jgi:hypothetical protein